MLHHYQHHEEDFLHNSSDYHETIPEFQKYIWSCQQPKNIENLTLKFMVHVSKTHL